MEKLTESEIQAELAGLSGWEYLDGSLATTFEFQNFKEAFAVMTRIAFECEALQHHLPLSQLAGREIPAGAFHHPP